MTKKLFILIFVCIIGLPLICSIFGFTFSSQVSENRSLQSFPKFKAIYLEGNTGLKRELYGFYKGVSDYKVQFENFFNDHFIFKTPLFFSFRFIETTLFSTNPLPKKVIQGTDGWMFLGDGYNKVILSSKGIVNFNAHKLEVIKNRLLERFTWLSSRHIDYYVAIAPNKHSVYGNYLSILKSHKPTKLEQLKKALDSTKIHLIDLKEQFQKYPKDRLFLKTNTHWNQLGAFLGTQTLIDKIKAKYNIVEPLDINAYKIYTTIDYNEDLTDLLQIEKPEEHIVLAKKKAKAFEIDSKIPVPDDFLENENKIYIRHFKSNVNNLKVMVFRDSFGSDMINSLSECFGEVIFVWSAFLDRSLIENEKPDIVIHEIVERDLYNLSIKDKR